MGLFVTIAVDGSIVTKVTKVTTIGRVVGGGVPGTGGPIFIRQNSVQYDELCNNVQYQQL